MQTVSRDAGATIQELLVGTRLEQELSRLSAGLSGAAAVAVFDASNTVAITSSGGPMRSMEQVADDTGPIGCLIKPMSAALVAQAVEEGEIALEDPVELVSGSPLPIFRGVTIRHLLNHTHGLDATAYRAAPYRKDGFIDASRLHSRVASHPRLHESGDLYSYGCAGLWIAAALLEQIRNERFGRMLVDKIFVPLNMKSNSANTAQICAATGDGVVLSLMDLVRFVKWQTHVGARDAIGEMSPGSLIKESHPMPGWSVERGICLGWKYYGDGWYGHNANRDGTSIAARFNTEDGSGIVIRASGVSAPILLARLCGGVLPELRDLKVPVVLPTQQIDHQDVQAIAGLYENAAVSVRILAQESGVTSCDIAAREGSETGCQRIVSKLRPCTDRAYLMESGSHVMGPWLQFLKSRTGSYEYLWNGREVLRRTERVV